MLCNECSADFTPSKRGRQQEFCSTKCRMRAYRRRVAQRRNVTQPSKEDAETIRLLRKDNARLRRLLREALEKLGDTSPAPVFPIKVIGGRWKRITSTKALQPGSIVRLRGDENADHVILEKKGRSVSVQCLRDGTVSTTSSYEVKANWTINSRKGRFDLVKHWKKSQS